MEPKVRHGVFETNSSSTHSVCIATGKIGPPSLKGQVLEIGPGEFGWEVEDHYDFYTKASYLYTWCYNQSRTYDDSDVELELTGERKEKLDMLTEVLKEYTGCSEVLYTKSLGYYSRGYIDHQSDSCDCPSIEVFTTKDSLVNFLFNNSSFIHTDNDNY